MFEHSRKFGILTLALVWNDQGLLSRIECIPGDPASRRQDPLPSSLDEVFDSIHRYLDLGEPMPEPRWNLFDQMGWSPFQERVYRLISGIPFGETRPYSWVSVRLGSPGAARAVGQALRRNPIPLLIPCHRVVSATGIGGFMGAQDPGSPEILLKEKLISIEHSYLNPVFSFLEAS